MEISYSFVEYLIDLHVVNSRVAIVKWLLDVLAIISDDAKAVILTLPQGAYAVSFLDSAMFTQYKGPEWTLLYYIYTRNAGFSNGKRKLDA